MEIEDIDLKKLIEDETGGHFNREGYVKCPFHNEKTPSLSIKFHPDKNKWKFKCFGCDASGDAIDFIMKLKSFDYKTSRKYLGMDVKKTVREEKIEKIKKYIDWQLANQDDKKGFKVSGIFEFVDSENNPIYYKVKFIKPDGTKITPYYHLEENKVINNRGTDEVPYNFYNSLKAIREEKTIIFVEGEKDANTINSIFKNDTYVATSVKGCKNIDVFKRDFINVYIISDTGEAGDKYKNYILNELKPHANILKVINLPNLKSLGNNKDVTDWIAAGNTQKDLLNAFKRSLNLKSKYELQQDFGGIYKMVYSKSDDEFKKIYITNFTLMNAARINFINEEIEGVNLTFKSPTGAIIEKTGPATVFDDVRSLKNFLGTLDLAFKGRIDDLTEFKAWINKYFALEIQEIYSGVQFKIKENKNLFITPNGALASNQNILNIKSDNRNNISIFELESLTADELKELKKHIFRFSGPEKTISILGTVINNLAVAQCQELKIKMHHLMLIGEAGSGKSTVLENCIAPILNYETSEIKSLGLATNFSLIKDLSDGNYSMLYEEHKPSRWDRYKISKISEILRNLYDRSTVARGDKSLKSKNFYLCRPIVIAGEESYHNNEKALIDRSCIIYMSKNERTNTHSEAMEWILENEILLKKLGKDLIDTVLDLSATEYLEIRKKIKFKDLKDRPLNTAINISMGIQILNLLFKKKGIKTVSDYNQYIEQNIKTEVLEGGSEAHSVVEQMINLYNDMIEDGRAFNSEEVIKCRGDGIFIKTSEMINQIHEHINRVNAEIIPLSLKDFRKQAKKAGYILGTSDKLIKIGIKPVRFDTYSAEKLRALSVNSIIDPELEEVTDNVVPFK